MIANQDLARVQGATAYDVTGERIGRVGAIYTDDATGEPTWVSVSTGFFGLSESLAPLTDASLHGEDLRLNYDKAKVKDAPNVEADRNLDADEERRLSRITGWTTAQMLPNPGTAPVPWVGPPYLVRVPRLVRAPGRWAGSRSHPACLRLAHRGGRLSRDTL